jgi:hypothetical protein
MMSPFSASASRVFTAFVSRLQQNNPFALNCTIGCVLCAGSDAIAQQIEQNPNGVVLLVSKDQDDVDATDTAEEKDVSKSDWRTRVKVKDFDYQRFISAGLIGALVSGFVYPYAYARLDAILPGTTVRSVLTKSLVEIATVGLFVNSVSMGFRGILTGQQGTDVASHVAREMPTVTLNDFRIWFPYNLLAFSLIPVHIRPATTSVMEAGWQTYISLCSHGYHHDLPLSETPKDDLLCGCS